MFGAGSGIRTHAARKGHGLSRPAPLDPHVRVNPLGPRDAADKLRNPGAKTRCSDQNGSRPELT